MKRIRKFVKRISKVDLTENAEDFRESLASLAAKTRGFAEALHSEAIREQTADLLRRIEALETELRAMKNGGPVKRIKL